MAVGEQKAAVYFSWDGTRRELWAQDVSGSVGKRAQRRQGGAVGG